MNTTQDEDHLRLLSIFHYVLGGLVALGSCFALIYVVLGIVFMATNANQSGGPPAALGAALTVFGVVFLIVGWTMAGLLIWAGRCLAQRTKYTFCLVVAVLSCFFFPLGTALGVFTFIVLMRPSVKPFFGVTPVA
ncbi:MAG TPA: hypothetical protein VK846_15525 [Candidatus Limnocylindria bacterium]|nr:hypothetical protein [Candidatus Limnocylindria bacterium]